MGEQEFFFKRIELIIVEIELHFERTVRYPPRILEQCDGLLDDLGEFHRLDHTRSLGT